MFLCIRRSPCVPDVGAPGFGHDPSALHAVCLSVPPSPSPRILRRSQVADVSEKQTAGCPPRQAGILQMRTDHTQTHDRSTELTGAGRVLLRKAQREAPGAGLRSSRNTDPDWWAHPSSEGSAWGLCGAGLRGARRSLWAPAPDRLLLQGLAGVRNTLARAVLALDTCA